MGLFDIITGRRAPAPGRARRDVEDLRTALLALNRPTAPFAVREASQGWRPGDEAGADLVAEWRIADAAWFEIFAKAGLRKAAQVLLRLDEERGEVRATLRDWEIEWRAGVPSFSLSAESFRGRKIEVSFGKGWAFREEDLLPGKVYDWRFDTGELKGPLQEVVAESGWAWRPVAFGRL